MEGKESAIVFATWAIVFATLLGPILAVQVQKAIERIKERHSRKTWVFQTLMATRGQRVAPNHVQALNMIDLAFYGARRLGLHHRTKSEQSVIDAWHEYLRHLNHGPQEPTEANMTSWGASGNELFYNLLFAVAVNVGYKITREQLKEGGYSPVAHGYLEIEQNLLRQNALRVLTGQQSLKIEMNNE